MVKKDTIGSKQKYARRENEYEKKLYALRQTVNALCFRRHLSRRTIAKELNVSRTFVTQWTRSPEQDFTVDMRGWTKGVRRKWDISVEKKIHEIHRYLKDDPYQFYTGATAIAQEWKVHFPEAVLPPLRTIGKIMSDLGLTARKMHCRRKGASRYLCYPEHTVYSGIGKRVLEADFVGKKYITGRGEPINFIGFSFKKAPRLRYFKRIEGQTTTNFIRECSVFFDQFERPHCVKVDNSLAVIGSASGKRNISKAMKFLLEKRIYPVFAVPRKPFSQASIEGNNSVFSRKFWNHLSFSSLEEIDEKLAWFNEASVRYTGYQPSIYENDDTFIPRVYFIRQVHEDQTTRAGYIGILNETVPLPSSYINYFVLAEWNVNKERLIIHFEKDEDLITIEQIPFLINTQSK